MAASLTGQARVAAVSAGRNARPQGCRGEQREQRFVASQRVLVAGVAGLDHALNSPRRSRQHALDFVGLGWRQGQELRLSVVFGRIGVCAVECERVKVHVEVQRVATGSSPR